MPVVGFRLGFGLGVHLYPGAVGICFGFRWVGPGKCCRGFGDSVIRDSQYTAFLRFGIIFCDLCFLYKLPCCYFYVNYDEHNGYVLFCSV